MGILEIEVVAHAALTAVANWGMAFTVLPMMMAMWFFTPRSPFNSSLTVAFLYFWTLVVMIGANVFNPITTFTGNDQNVNDATLILCTIYGALAAGFALLGCGWAWFIGMLELLPWGARTERVGEQVKRRMFRRSGNSVYASAAQPKRALQPESWGIPGLVPSWQYMFVMVLGFLAAVGVPAVLYTWFMAQPGQQLLAWLLPLFLGSFIYLILWLYNRYAPGGEPAVWGMGSDYASQDPAGNNYGMTKREVEKLEQKRRRRVAINIWCMAFLQFLGYLVLGGTRFYYDDVDTNWLVAVGWFGALLVILCILGLVMYFRRRADRVSKPSKQDCDAHAYEADGGDESEQEDDDDDEPAVVESPNDTGSTGTAYKRTSAINNLYRDDA